MGCVIKLWFECSALLEVYVMHRIYTDLYTRLHYYILYIIYLVFDTGYKIYVWLS